MSLAFISFVWSGITGPARVKKPQKIQTENKEYTNNFWGWSTSQSSLSRCFGVAKLERLVQPKWREQERLDDDIFKLTRNSEGLDPTRWKKRVQSVDRKQTGNWL